VNKKRGRIKTRISPGGTLSGGGPDLGWQKKGKMLLGQGLLVRVCCGGGFLGIFCY